MKKHVWNILIFVLPLLFIPSTAIPTHAQPQPIEPASSQSIVPEVEDNRKFLQSIEHDPTSLFHNGERLLAALDTLITYGYLEEADREIARLAEQPFEPATKEVFMHFVFEQNLRLVERSMPLIKKGFLDFDISEHGISRPGLGIDFRSLIEKQETPQDKLRAAYFYGSSVYPSLVERMKFLKFKDDHEKHVLCSVWGGEAFPVKDGEDRKNQVNFTYLPEGTPEFSDTRADNAGKKGKYIIVRKVEGGVAEKYFIDWNMMPCLPVEYLPETFDDITRVVAITSRWVKGDTYRGGMQSYVPVNTIKIYDYTSGKRVAQLNDFKQRSPQFLHMVGKTDTYYIAVNTAGVCNIILAWLKK